MLKRILLYYYHNPLKRNLSWIFWKWVIYNDRISFAVGEILLLIGLSVESGHLNNWSTPRESCLVIKEGLFSAAGVFQLATVFLAAGLYMTAVRAQRMFEEQENVRREVLESYHIHSSPPRSSPPLQPMPPIAREDPVIRHSHHHQETPLFSLLQSTAPFCKLSAWTFFFFPFFKKKFVYNRFWWLCFSILLFVCNFKMSIFLVSCAIKKPMKFNLFVKSSHND